MILKQNFCLQLPKIPDRELTVPERWWKETVLTHLNWILNLVTDLGTLAGEEKLQDYLDAEAGTTDPPTPVRTGLLQSQQLRTMKKATYLLIYFQTFINASNWGNKRM